MKIPDKLQVFRDPVTLSMSDQERLSPHLSHWGRLHNILLLRPSEEDLKKLYVLELMGKKRRRILDRLIAPIMRHERRRVEEKAGV